MVCHAILINMSEDCVNMQQQNQFKHPKPVRAYFAERNRKARAKKKKAMEAQVCGPTSTAPEPTTIMEASLVE
jgi:hypothetical protein